jgi:hypothetical protein
MDNRSCAGISSNLYHDFIEKTVISAYFIHQGFVSIEELPKTERLNSTFFTETFLLSLVQSVSLFRPKMQAQGYWPHIENARSYNFALSLYKTEEPRFIKLLQPLYSPDLAPCDFFLFGYLKKKTQGINFRSQNGVISAVTTILREIPVRTLS